MEWLRGRRSRWLDVAFVASLAMFVLLRSEHLLARQAREQADNNRIVTSLERPRQYSLNGEWQFREDPEDAGERQGWHKPGTVRRRVGKVPLPWQLAFPELRNYLGVAWYEREFDVPQDARKRRVALHFLGVDHQAKVWVNGQFAGEHEGSLTPFILDVSRQIKPGAKNTVTLKVTDPETGTRTWTAEQVIAFSGLWRDVYLEITGTEYVSDVYVVPDLDRCTADAQITVSGRDGPAGDARSVRVEAKSPAGDVVSADRALPSSMGTERSRRISIPMRLGTCVPWQLDDPALYEVRVSLRGQGAQEVDSATAWFGMRKLEARGKHILLNNRPIYVVGGWLDPSPLAGPDEVNWALPPPYAPLSDEDVKRDILSAKALGVVLVRRIMRSINPRFLYWADRLGLLVQEGGPWMPARGIVDRGAFDGYRQGWQEIVVRDRNHPSVAIWELFTESAGLATGDYSSWSQSKEIVAELYDHVKRLDGTRLLLDNSGGRSCCALNYRGNHVKTDIDDVLFLGLASAPWIGGVDEFRENMARITEHGKPVVNALLHNLTSRVVDAGKARRLWGGHQPWWFTAPPGITADSTKLTGFQERFHKWGVDDIYGDFASFTRDSDRYQFEGLKFQSEQTRKNPNMTGYLGFLFDAVPHFIGAIDIFRDRKGFFDELRALNTQDLVIPDGPRRNVWSGETVRVDVHVSHFSVHSLDRGVVRWRFDGEKTGGEIGGVRLEPGEVKRVGEVAFKTETGETAKNVRMALALEQDDQLLSANYLDLLVFPEAYRMVPGIRIGTYGLTGTIRTRLDILGYEPLTDLDPSLPVVATQVDEKLAEYVRSGGTVLLLISEDVDLIGFTAEPKIHPAEWFLRKHGLVLAGNEFHVGGITGAHFVKPNRTLFARIPFRNPIAWPFQRVMPRSVLVGVRPDQNQDILAGAYGSFFRNTPADSSGKRWPSEVTPTLMQFRYGQGRMIISTFNLLAPLVEDPVATVMFHDLVTYAKTDFRPQAELSAARAPGK